MQVKIVSLTHPCGLFAKSHQPEDLIAYCARVSNPENQKNTETAPRLLKFLIKQLTKVNNCLLYTSPSPRDGLLARMPSSA